ncbi:LLM class F420-dependent oxidoreductase [Saccharothrix variisporea]|uniref:F420-dependent oxidoreductase-like protein n=1 Tax=Saccharothrix variisporea TaxID=543527 RepID=A0A495X4P4_9PSEU|nr:LLM class F420-dependent oxidoreductase [Saccharothrix variisporea]RKT68950.1 F420-dependent oxidoreductase-like protein [Saccharothrix variisporea]
MEFSVFLPTGFGRDWAGATDPVDAFDTLTRLAKAADELGYAGLWAPDHLHTIPPSQDFLFESWTTLSALARETSRIRLGHLVTGNGYRNPALQAKMASTVDVLSRGRFTFGIGAGWYEPDHVGYGYEFPPPGERLRRLEEAVQVVRALWAAEEATFEGRHYSVRRAINQPKGVQERIPLMIAGAGERVTLRIVARYADACNVIESPEGLAHKFEVLRKHCADLGTDYDRIKRTATTACIIADTDEEARALVPPGSEFAFPGDLASYGLIGTLDTIRERIARYAEVGVQELVIGFLGTDVEPLERFAAEFLG